MLTEGQRDVLARFIGQIDIGQIDPAARNVSFEPIAETARYRSVKTELRPAKACRRTKAGGGNSC